MQKDSNVREIFTHDHHLEDYYRQNPHARIAMEKYLAGETIDPIERNLVERVAEMAVKDSIYKHEKSKIKRSKRK